MANELTSNSQSIPPPATSAHKMIGTLNVLFAGIMLLCGVCSGASVLMQVAMAPVSESYQKQMFEGMEAKMQQDREQRIAELKQQEEEAADDEQKAVYAAEREALEQQPPANMPMADIMAAYRDPRLIGYMIADFSSGILFNLLMLASGIGLIASRSWARIMGLWVAWLKIARLVLVYGFAIAVVVPVFSKAMGEMMDKMQIPQQPGAPPMPDMGQTVATVYGIALSAGAVMMILFGAVYPIIMLWVLTRPAVKAACGEVPVQTSAEAS